MPHTFFFSWQSDIDSRVGRGLIEDALQRAIRALKADAEVNFADRNLAVDRDRKGVPGSPPLMETIFGKIDAATAFLSDRCCQLNRRVVADWVKARHANCHQNRRLALGGSRSRRTQAARAPRSAHAPCD